jgi:hypothetical protein
MFMTPLKAKSSRETTATPKVGKVPPPAASSSELSMAESAKSRASGRADIPATSRRAAIPSGVAPSWKVTIYRPVVSSFEAVLGMGKLACPDIKNTSKKWIF